MTETSVIQFERMKRPSIDGFVSASNAAITMLQILAEEVREEEPGTAAAITGFTELLAGQALDLIRRWPA